MREILLRKHPERVYAIALRESASSPTKMVAVDPQGLAVVDALARVCRCGVCIVCALSGFAAGEKEAERVIVGECPHVDCELCGAAEKKPLTPSAG